MAPFRPGLVSVTFRALAPREIVALAARCGLEGVEWGGDVHVPNATAAGEVRRMTADAGLAVAAYGSYWRAEGPFGPVLEAAAALGAPTVRVWAGREGSSAANRGPVADALREACVAAAKAGLTVSLEYHAGTLTDTLASTLELVRRVDHPAVRLLWQPVPERTPAERLEEVRAVLPWLSNLHVFQWSRPAGETVRHPLAEGFEEWREVIESVERGARSGECGEERAKPLAAPHSELPTSPFALLEFLPGDDPALLPREAATLRRILEAVR